MERDPHAMIEGMAIAAFAIGSHLMFVYIRGEFNESIRTVEARDERSVRQGTSRQECLWLRLRSRYDRSYRRRRVYLRRRDRAA